MSSMLLLLLLSVVPLCHTCISLGCLGVGCLPAIPCLFGCLPTLRLHMPCPCGGGFSCMNGGCVMAKARAAKTFQDEDNNEVTQIQSPNNRFQTCCNLLNVPEACNGLCSYEGYNRESVKSTLAITAQCPFSALPQIHFCAARGADHSQCCRDSGVPNDCNVFCDQKPGNTTQLNLSHLHCFEELENIRGCFLEHALREFYEHRTDTV